MKSPRDLVRACPMVARSISDHCYPWKGCKSTTVLATAVVHQYPWFIPLVLGEWDERKGSVLSSERMLLPGHVSTRGLQISWPQAIESFLFLSCCYLLCSFRGPPPPENHFCGGGLLSKDASSLFRTQLTWQLFGYKTNSAIYKPRFSALRW